MKANKAKLKILAGIGIALFIGVVYWAINSVPQPDKITLTDGQESVMTFDSNVIREEKDGKVIWDITADDLAIGVKTQQATLTNMVAHFYMEDGRVLEAKSPHAVYDQQNHNIIIDQGANITSTDGASLKCETLKWLSDKEMLQATGNAEVHYQNAVAFGDVIESTDGFKRVVIKGNARVVRGGNNDDNKK